MQQVKRPPAPLYLAVITHNVETGEVEQRRVIDHSDHDARVWLGKHCFWAFRNKKAVTTAPLESRDEPFPDWMEVGETADAD